MEDKIGKFLNNHKLYISNKLLYVYRKTIALWIIYDIIELRYLLEEDGIAKYHKYEIDPLDSNPLPIIEDGTIII